MALLSHFIEASRYLRALINAPKSNQSCIDSARQQQVDNMLSFIDKSAIGLDEATIFLEALVGPSPFTQSDIDALSVKVQQKCAQGGETPHLDNGNPKMQQHLFMYNYFTKDDWAQLRDEAANIDTRFSIIVDRSLLIGLVYPSEKTFSSLLSIIAVAGRELWDADTAFAHLQNLKSRFKAQRKAKLEADGKPKSTIGHFPVSFYDFKVASGMDYNAEAPPVSVSLIEQRRATMATRRSHKTVRASGQEQVGGAAGTTAIGLLMQQLLGFQQQVHQRNPNRLSLGRSPLALTFNGEPRGSPSPAATSTVPESDIELRDDTQQRALASPSPASMSSLRNLSSPIVAAAPALGAALPSSSESAIAPLPPALPSPTEKQSQSKGRLDLFNRRIGRCS